MLKKKKRTTCCGVVAAMVVYREKEGKAPREGQNFFYWTK